MLYSVSYTTRKPRNGEQNGIDYYFITEDDFKNRIKNNKWAEWAKVYDNYYGTSSEFIDTSLAAGSDILLDIDFYFRQRTLFNKRFKCKNSSEKRRTHFRFVIAGIVKG